MFAGGVEDVIGGPFEGEVLFDGGGLFQFGDPLVLTVRFIDEADGFSLHFGEVPLQVGLFGLLGQGDCFFEFFNKVDRSVLSRYFTARESTES